MSGTKILINIVLFNPDPDKILALIRICSIYQQAKILLFDNSENFQFLNYEKSEKIIFYKSAKNVGVSGAYYYACKFVENNNFDFILFLDQDSLLPENFISRMISGFYQLQKLYPRLCAVGPSWEDPRIINWYQERENRIKNKLKAKIKAILKPVLKVRTQFREKKHKLLRLDHILISSGMFIWIPLLKEIGYPKKEYFIDLIDIEWCLRALSKDYQIEIVKTVKMQHTIGEFKSLKRKFLIYKNPMRYYYSIRNSFYLFRENSYPFLFRLFILKINIFDIRFIPFIPESKKSLFAAINGIKDGLFMKKKLVSIKE